MSKISMELENLNQTHISTRYDTNIRGIFWGRGGSRPRKSSLLVNYSGLRSDGTGVVSREGRVVLAVS